MVVGGCVGGDGKYKRLFVVGWKRWCLEDRSGCHGRVDVMVGGLRVSKMVGVNEFVANDS